MERAAVRQGADARRRPRSASCATAVARRDREQRRRQRPSQSRHHDHDRRDERDEADGARVIPRRRSRRALRARQPPQCCRPPAWRRPSAAGTCWRKMMVAIPIVKPSITGQGMYASNRPTPANAAITISTPASTPTTIDGIGAVAGDDRHQHHRHRPGRSRDLDVRAAEDGRHDAGDDRRDQPRLGTEPGRDAERQRQRQRHDPDGQPRQQVGAPRLPQPGVVGSPGQHLADDRPHVPISVVRAPARLRTRHPQRPSINGR